MYPSRMVQAVFDSRLVLFLFFSLCALQSLSPCSAQHEDNMVRRLVPFDIREETSSPSLAFDGTWQLLGPFQLGTREGSWGADPLEYFGGFRSLDFDPEAKFPSSLPVNGTARWSTIKAKQTGSSLTSGNVSLSVGYSNVDWNFLKVVYGWAAVQYQAWARGNLVIGGNETQHIVLFTDAIIEYWIDDVHYFGGDAYTFRKAPPVLHLSPGPHKIELRLWRDVRAFGGINDPTIDVLLEATRVSGTLELATPGILVSDVVDGKLASPIASITLRNSGEGGVEIVSIESSDSNFTHNSDTSSVMLAAGQTRPVAFHISLKSHNASSLHIVIHYKSIRGEGQLRVSQSLSHKSIYSPHKNHSLPIIISNHGAGVEASNPMVAHALDPVLDLCSWVLFPTGVTPWSGDDWHNWGFADVQAAVKAVPSWIEHVGWTGPGVDVDRWIMVGHSNGGQGTWYTLTHHPDRLVAAAPLSGYSSIQKYVPYELWQPTDPRRTAIISASLNSYRHEMLVENIKGIPVLQQHGELDNNVPTYHSRFLRQQLSLTDTNSTYSEPPGQGHWWDGIMTTDPLTKFYKEQTINNVTLPRVLTDFDIVVGDPGDMGSKSGFRVTHLDDPGQYGRVHVRGNIVTTSNVLSIEIQLKVLQTESITIDGTGLSLAGTATSSVTLSKFASDWKVGTIYEEDENEIYRRGRQLGTMNAILRTRGPFIIRHYGSNTSHVAIQISRNLHQYFYADAVIVSASNSTIAGTGNVISVIIGTNVPSGLNSHFPIQVSAGGVSVRDFKGRIHQYNSNRPISAIFLRPLPEERLELVVWGSNAEALVQASRLVPMMTGVGQPDFVVLGESARWRGVEGAIALGFLDHQWELTPSSVVS
ncbi:hypothetical protein B0J11DRAFT_542760 [Dendryphion nanum]|uniref:Peptidase S9 prolyl oligopeptidase catalytic domain-containing protein n=1 Tax=Dendryphion nanum TaxID=256645 RepID=A0A9P9D3R3_9PLEO|nr:hypothetical protein B0J11DRAFT_542760 [Dendryphion nanum]